MVSDKRFVDGLALGKVRLMHGVLKPIESAPHYTDILIFVVKEPEDAIPTISMVDVGRWDWIEKSDWDGADVYGWTSYQGIIEDPTHWIELPVVVSTKSARTR